MTSDFDQLHLTAHFKTIISERDIDESWLRLVFEAPTRTEEYEDGTKHYIKQIPEHGNRWLRLVINRIAEPNRAVTAFFDRRLLI